MNVDMDGDGGEDIPRGVDLARQDAAADRYEAQYREETALVAQRINWLIGSQAFLVAAYIEAVTSTAVTLFWVSIIIALAGICLALLVWGSLRAAFNAQAGWLNMARKFSLHAPLEFPLVCRDKRENRAQFGVVTEGAARRIAHMIPWVLIGLWIFLVIGSAIAEREGTSGAGILNGTMLEPSEL